MKVIISPKAQKQVHRLPQREANKITRKLHELEMNPFAGKLLSGELKNFHSLRAWPYRIIYRIIKDKDIILVNAVEHRQGVYK